MRYIGRMDRLKLSPGSTKRFASALKMALVALFLLLTGGPAVIAQYDDYNSNSRFWLQERERTQQRQRAKPVVVQRPTHLIRRAAPRKGFAVEMPAPGAPADVDPNGAIGPDGQPIQTTDAQTPAASPAPPPAPSAPVVAAKPADPTFFVAVIGDNIAQLLAQGLQDAFSDNPDVSILRRAKENTGLVRDDYFDWQKGVRDLLASNDKIGVGVMMIGSNDRQSLRDSAGTYEARSPRWKQIYAARIEAIGAMFRDKKIPLVWVGMPVMKNERLSADLIDFNELYRDSAGKSGASFVDVWDAFADDRGQFSLYGPDVNGQIVKLRTGDGVHFTKPGSRKLAHFVEGDIRHAYEDAHPKTEPTVAVLEQPPADTRSNAPAVAEPETPAGAEAAPAASAPGRTIELALPLPPPAPVPVVPVRPTAGPVIVLTAPAVSPGGQLATRSKIAPANGAQRIVERVLVQGATPDPRPGRADDFTWPRL